MSELYKGWWEDSQDNGVPVFPVCYQLLAQKPLYINSIVMLGHILRSL